MPVAKIRLNGLSWKHRRATGPLAPLSAAFSALRPNVEINWTDRSLAGFEHQPIAETAKAFDLVIFDPPFCGDIVASNCFLPLDRALPDLLGDAADGLYVGPTLASYRFGGAVWGAPIDAATEHAIFRPDALARAGEPPPGTWAEVVALGERLRRKGVFLGAAVVTPHLGLVGAALMANRGTPWPTDVSARFAIDRVSLQQALESAAELVAYCPEQALGWDSIALHEAMVARDDIAYAPCVYGHATYGEADTRARLWFGDFPGAVAPHAAGTAVGGTALAVSSRTAHVEACLDFVRFALSARAKIDLIAGRHGQPARVEAWDDATTDAAFRGYYLGVRESMERAWIRPRQPGYIPFQHEFGHVAARFVRREINLKAALEAVHALAAKVNRTDIAK